MAFDDKTDRTDVSAVPLYQQVMDDLKGEIARGVYASGSRIPSEMELAKSYGVGRITVDGVEHILHEGESILMPARHPHAVFGQERFKMLLVVVF